MPTFPRRTLRAVIKDVISDIPVLGPIARAIHRRLRPGAVPFRSSSQFWEARYRAGGTSGAGSYNRLARFKADTLNRFVRDHGVRSVVELGCGDGAQLALAQYPRYVGYDVSPRAIELCRARFADDATKEFHLVDPAPTVQGDLSLSLDVVYHLVEDEVFDRYMRQLFDAAKRFVIVYASNEDRPSGAVHVRHRRFTRWVEGNRPDWKLRELIPNPYPYDDRDPENTSFADFYVFAR